VIFSKGFKRNPVTLSFLLVAPVLAIVEGGLAGWRGGVEGIEKRASLGLGVVG